MCATSPHLSVVLRLDLMALCMLVVTLSAELTPQLSIIFIGMPGKGMLLYAMRGQIKSVSSNMSEMCHLDTFAVGDDFSGYRTFA